MSTSGVGKAGSRKGVLAIAMLSAVAFVMSSLMHAQAPAAGAAREPQPQNRLPVRRVVLYKSGVGYFEHLGRVRGNQAVTIDFTSGQLDDVLKSLTALDLDGGRVSNVSYNSEASLDRRLSALRLPVGQETTRAQFLAALRGARVEVRTAGTRMIGRLLSVERVDRKTGDSITSVDTLSIVTDAGDVQTVALDPGVSVRIADDDLNQEVSRYLALVASVRDQDLRRLTIATAGQGDRDLFVSYVSEVPVWKATYRLVMPPAGESRRPLLQGWAIVDNTVGEDWENVQLSLVAGAPQSFVQSISRPYYVQRPVVPLPARVTLSPQTHQGAISGGSAGALAGTVTDSSGSVIPGATVHVTRNGGLIADVVTDSNGRYRLPGLTPGAYDVSVRLQGFNTVTRNGVDVSGGMETVLNAALQVGGLNESINVSMDGVSSTFRSSTTSGLPAAAPAGRAGGGGGGGRGGRGSSDAFGPRLDSIEEVVARAQAAQQIDAAAAQLGDLFEYKLKEPITIRKNQSALVPILSGEVQADKVSLWNAATGATRPLRAIWLTNGTGLTLDGGTFSIVEGQAFAGEGIIEPLKAGERRLLSYALDLGVVVDAKGEPVPTRVTKVTIARGLVIQQTEERQRRVYTVRNDDTEPRVVVIEHPARAGWTLGGTIKADESTPAWHRFRVNVAAKTTSTFTVEETHPLQTQYAINSITDDQVTLLVREQAISGAVEASLREVLTRKANVARLGNEIAARQSEIEAISRDQERVRENMRSLKGSSEERQLLQRYVKQLDDQENRIEALRKELQSLTAERQKAQADLTRFIEGLSM